MTPEGVKFVGKVGREYSIEEGQQAARICAINLLGVAQAAVGDLERIQRIVKVVGFVNATPDFPDVHKVINGASDLITEVLGDAEGQARALGDRHGHAAARSRRRGRGDRGDRLRPAPWARPPG